MFWAGVIFLPVERGSHLIEVPLMEVIQDTVKLFEIMLCKCVPVLQGRWSYPRAGRDDSHHLLPGWQCAPAVCHRGLWRRLLLHSLWSHTSPGHCSWIANWLYSDTVALAVHWATMDCGHFCTNNKDNAVCRYGLWRFLLLYSLRRCSCNGLNSDTVALVIGSSLSYHGLWPFLHRILRQCAPVVSSSG